MRSDFQERHFDYKLVIPSLAPGQRLNGVPLVLDPDSQFELRSRAVRIPYDTATGTYTGLENLAMRFTDANNEYRSQALIPQSVDMAFFGQQGSPKPIFPGVRYPKLGTINVDVQNLSGTVTLTNVELYFRGVKLFPWGGMPSKTYPTKFTPLNFCYPQLVTALPVTTPAAGIRQVFVCRNDADFVLRALQAGIPGAQTTWEVFLTLRDHDLYPYSNAPVHVDVLCGNGFTGNVYPNPAGTFVNPVGPGPSLPGLLYPEVWIKRNEVFYIDIARNDAGYAGAAAVNFPISFLGMKVFQS